MNLKNTVGAPRPLALVTGASIGLGRDFAEIFARNGFDLILVARSADKLKELASHLGQAHSTQARVITQDLSVAGAAQALYEKLGDDAKRIEVLVNNAGFGMQGGFTQISAQTHREMMLLNMVTLTELTQLLLPSMIEHKSGKILNVASTAAFQPGPFMAVYYATKAYVLSFSEALANELQGTGVTVTTLCPGPTLTGFQNTAGIAEMGVFKSPAVMASMPVAQKGFRAMMRGKRVEIPGVLNKVTAQSNRLLPRACMTQIVRKLQEGK